MSEKNPSKFPPVAVAAGNGVIAPPAATAAAAAAGETKAAPVGQPVAAPAKPPELFGGHRGGGKKRADGLVAGSPAAIAADREKERLRGLARRSGQKVAALPPPLPGVLPAAENSPAALVPGEPALAGTVGDVATGAAVVLPTFVSWSEKILGRPIKLLTRIVDRFRVGKLMERIRRLGLDKADEVEAEKRIAYKQQQVDDFNSALTNCAVIELNKRRAPGAEHGHWLELAMTTGELVNCHLDNVDWLEKKLLEKAEREKAAAVVKN